MAERRDATFQHLGRRALVERMLGAGSLLALGGIAACTPAAPAPTQPPSTTSAQAPISSPKGAPIALATVAPKPATAAPSVSAPPPTPIPPSGPSVSATRTATSAGPVPTPTRAIVVNRPAPGERVKSPIRVSGLARVFEATFSYELLANGTIIARGFTTASNGAPDWGDFDFEVSYPTPTANTPAILRVYEVSMKDGSPMNVVEIALILESSVGSGAATATPGNAATLTPDPNRRLLVYFAKAEQSQTIYVAVTRPWPDTPEVGRAALEALIQGPNATEQALGLSSPIPPGTRLIELRIESKVAYANFSRELDPGGGSARVAAIHQVIDRTLRQFSTVERVVVQIEGNSRGILQP